MMLSEAGRQYERSKRIKPFQKAQRERVYKSFSLQIDRPKSNSKFSPFNTVSRQSRNSFLLRVTQEANVDTIYEPKHALTLPQGRRTIIDKANFKRIIGGVKDQDFSIDRSAISKKCQKSHISYKHRPLTVSETHNWRKTRQHFDFSKQITSKRAAVPAKTTTVEESTKQDFMNSLQTITESNFNNFKRFSLKANPNKAHKFQSDSPHKYLDEVQKQQTCHWPDILTSNQSYVRKSMARPKGEKRFFLYRQKIVTRQDRADKNWHTLLEYHHDEKAKQAKSHAFSQQTERKGNQIYSQYPIRLSLAHPLRVKE